MNKDDISEVDEYLDTVVEQASSFLATLEQCQTVLNEKLPPGTMRIVRSEFDGIEGDTKRHISTLNDLKEVCNSVENMTECKEAKNVHDVWKLIG